MTSSQKVHRIEGVVMPVNAYLVEDRAGVVLIDGMLAVSDARRVARALEDLGKPLLGALATHAHPDHYAGLATIVGARPVPILATEAIRRAIERDDAAKNAIVGPMLGGEWPSERVFPTIDVTPGETVRFLRSGRSGTSGITRRQLDPTRRANVVRRRCRLRRHACLPRRRICD